MANTKSKVCTLANSFIREGMNRSAAFVKAWASVKIENIDNRLFSLNMIDRQRLSEKEEVRELNSLRNEIAKKADIKSKTETITSASVAKRIENPYLTADERKAILDKMFNMMSFDIYNGTFSMDEYKALEASLYVTATQIAA